MKVVAITGKRQCESIDKPVPCARDDMVVVKVHVAPMCTEYKLYAKGTRSDTLGHEAAGEVVEAARSKRVKPGDRVVVMPSYPCGKCELCRAGEYIHCQDNVDPLKLCECEAGTATYAQYLLKQDWLLLPIPDDISYEHACMACCGLGPGFGAMQRMQVGGSDTVLVTGLGPVGLGTIINASSRAARVIGVDSHPFRSDLARQLGAEQVIDPTDKDAVDQIMALTGGVGADKAVDCSGVAAGQRLMLDSVRRRGHVAFVGESADFTVSISDDMIRKGLTLHGVWHWNLADAPRIIQLIRDSADKLDKQITHTFPMSQVRQAWELQLTGNCGKIILKPWE